MTATKTPRKTAARKPATPKTKAADNADLTANAPDSTAAKATGRDIPPPPTDQAGKSDTTADTKAGAEGDFKEPGSTLNPSDPAAPNYRFEPGEGSAAALAGDQSIDQGTGVQPPSPVLAPAGGGTDEGENGLVWTDETTARGRIISATKGKDGPTITGEEVLPVGASDALAAAAKERLQRRFAA